MLQHSAVYPRTLELLKKLMQEECLQPFNLVGGTALALQLGHRISVDIDLFSDIDFAPQKIIRELRNNYKLNLISEFGNSFIQQIEYPEDSQNYIKVDVIKYPYPLIGKVLEIDGIRMLSKEDIIPMKLSAIGNRGSKKDFFDIYFLLKEFTLEKMFELFEAKFPNVNYFHILKSLAYFEDADTEINPKMIMQVSWEEVKKEIRKQVKLFF